jgi:hypothetical protein
LRRVTVVSVPVADQELAALPHRASRVRVPRRGQIRRQLALDPRRSCRRRAWPSHPQLGTSTPPQLTHMLPMYMIHMHEAKVSGVSRVKRPRASRAAPARVAVGHSQSRVCADRVAAEPQRGRIRARRRIALSRSAQAGACRPHPQRLGSREWPAAEGLPHYECRPARARRALPALARDSRRR